MLEVVTLINKDGSVGTTETLFDGEVTLGMLTCHIPHLVTLVEYEPDFLKRFGHLFDKAELCFIQIHFEEGKSPLDDHWKVLFEGRNCLVRFELMPAMPIFQAVVLDNNCSLFVKQSGNLKSLCETLSYYIDKVAIEEIKKQYNLEVEQIHQKLMSALL